MTVRRRILVTGGAGFLGSHLCDTLLRAGNEVVCVDNLVTGNADNLAQARSSDRFEFVEHDLTVPLDLAGPLDAVFHMASPASPRDYLEHPLETLQVGSMGTLNVLGLARAKDARFLLASTSEVYGDPLVNPQPESYWGNVNPVGPRGVYDEAKRFAEALTLAYHRVHGVKTHIARIFNTYGPRMRPNDGRAVPSFISQALQGRPLTVFGDGSQTRSFCYVDDLIRGLRLLMDADDPMPVNLGNPEEFTVYELAEMVKRITGSRSSIVHEPLPTDDPKVRRPDITRAKDLLGWEPTIGIEEGLVKTVPFFRGVLSVVAPGGRTAR